MSKPLKFKSDEILKQLNNESTEEEEASESENIDQEIEFNPSRLRSDAIPTEGFYEGKKVTRQELEESENETEEESNEMVEMEDSDDIVAPEGSDDENLENDLEEFENDKEFNLIENLQKQQEADLKIAKGTTALQNQYSALLLMRLKMQGALKLTNALPTNVSYDEKDDNTPFKEACKNKEVLDLLKEINQSANELQGKLHELKGELQKTYDWDDVAETMMNNISNWSQRLKLGSGMKRGSVINRPVNQQIELALQEKQFLIQPTRHREHDSKIFGLEEQPDIVNDIYNDSDYYNSLLSTITGVSSKNNNKKKVETINGGKIVTKSKTLKINQVIENLQGFMQIEQQQPLGTDAFYRSLLK